MHRKTLEKFYSKNKHLIFKKHSEEILLNDAIKYKNNIGTLSKILPHYFKRTMYKAKGSKGKTTPYKALKNVDNLKQAFDYIKTKPKFYNSDHLNNLESYFRNCGTVAMKVANFCPKNAKKIYDRYNKKGKKLNILDTSCGFGSRMSAALLNGHNYVGFDPNEKLYTKLVKLKDFYKENKLTKNKCKLYCCGSEIYKKSLFETIDISFTSPPYFNLEIYSEDKGQSTTKFSNYDDWLEGFAKPTIYNTFLYMKVGGYAMINIKNMTSKGKHKLFDDWFSIFNSIKGFEAVEIFEIKHQAKRFFFKNTSYDEKAYTGFKEPIMVFRKIKSYDKIKLKKGK